MVRDLDEIGLWTNDVKNKIVANGGSVQMISEIPQDIKLRYKDVWEISQKTLLELSAIRNKFVDQSQSLNVYHADAKYSKISSALMYAWKIGLKSGVYYTRTKSKIENNSKLSSGGSNEVQKKPENTQFECFGCSS